MKTHLIALGGIGLLNGLAHAATCDTPTAMVGIPPHAQRQADGLAVAVDGGRLALWPIARRMKLNGDFLTEITFSDRSSCAIHLPAATENGASIPIAGKTVSAVDAAICDDTDGMCIPVHFDLRQ